MPFVTTINLCSREHLQGWWKTTVNETNYLLNHEYNLYILVVNTRISKSDNHLSIGEQRTALRSTVTYRQCNWKPKQPSRISYNGEPREQEKENKVAIKLRRQRMKGFTDSEPRVAKRQLHLLQRKNQPLQMAFKNHKPKDRSSMELRHKATVTRRNDDRHGRQAKQP